MPAWSVPGRIGKSTADVSVQGAGTSPTSGIRYGGFTGCTISTRERIDTCSLNLDAGIPELELPITAFGSRQEASARSVSAFGSTRSNTDAWT